VFGWETEAFGDVTMWRVPGYVGGEPEQPVARDVVAGMAPLPVSDGRPHWRVDFWVDDVDATVALAGELGGGTVVPAFQTEIFRQAVIADPAGASFSVTEITIAG
jgi:predicted enzyme related to lactoylglutathione lyase